MHNSVLLLAFVARPANHNLHLNTSVCIFRKKKVPGTVLVRIRLLKRMRRIKLRKTNEETVCHFMDVNNTRFAVG